MNTEKTNHRATEAQRGEREGKRKLPEGWEEKKLGDISEHVLGKMLDKNKNRGTLQPYLRNINVRWFSFDLSDLLEMRFLEDEKNRYSAVKGDVLVCEGGYPGRAAIWQDDNPIYFQKAIHRIRFYPCCSNRWFLYYLLSLDLNGSLENHFTGTGIRHLTGESLNEILIPLPSSPEQKRIVGILDEAFAAIGKARENAEKNLANTREVFESYLARLFGNPENDWEEKQICEIGAVYDGPHATPSTTSEGPIFLGIGSLVDGVVDLSETRHISESDFNKWTRRVKPKANDIVFSYETRLGQAAIIPEGIECCLGRRMGLVRCDEKKIIPKYFLCLYLSRPFQEYLNSRIVKGATVDRISIKDFPYFSMSIPPLPEQRRIVAELDALSAETAKLEAVYRKKIADLDELKKSILEKAFRGEL